MPMVHSVSIKKEDLDISASVRKAWPEIRIKKDVSKVKLHRQVNSVARTMIALIHWLVYKALA